MIHRAVVGTALLVLLALPALPGSLEGQDAGLEIAMVRQLILEGDDAGLWVFVGGIEAAQAEERAQEGDFLNNGDDAVTDEQTRAAIRFTDDGSLVRMNRSTVLSIRTEGDNRGALTRTLDMEGGEIWARITGREGTRTEVRTPTGVAAVRGTDFIVRVDPVTGATTVITLEGVLDFFSGVGEVEIPANHRTTLQSEDEMPEAVPLLPGDLDDYQELLQDAAGDGPARQEWLDLSIPGTDGRTLWIELDEETARRYVTGGGRR